MQKNPNKNHFYPPKRKSHLRVEGDSEGISEKGEERLHSHGLFDFFDGLGYRLAKHTAAILGYENIVLDADTAKVFPFLELVEVDEVLVGAFGMPFVDKGGHEVGSGLVGNDVAGLETASATKHVEAELGGRTGLVVVAYINLAVVLHVVNIEAHHVAKAVRHEERMSAVGYDVVDVALEDSKVFVALSKDAAGGGMNLLIGDAGTGDADGLHVGGKNQLVDGALAVGIVSADGNGTGDVATVVVGSLATGIHYEKASGGELVAVAVVVEYFAMGGHDDGEGEGPSGHLGCAFHKAGQFVFVAVAGGHLHGSYMHVVGGSDGTFDVFDLFGALDGTLFYASQDEFHGGIAAYSFFLDAEQGAELVEVVGTIGGEIVDFACFADGFDAEGLQVGERAAVVDAYRSGLIGYGGHGAGPDDVVDVDIVGEEIVFAIVAVEHAYEVGMLKAEEIEEGAVLAESIGVVGVVEWGFVIA